jgi:hypothetical protein
MANRPRRILFISLMWRPGILGFFDGIRTKIVQSVLAAALLFLIKEELTNAIRLALTAGPRAIGKPVKAIR